MELQFLGCGSGYNPALGNTNAFFTNDRTFYLLDCGFTAFPKLIRRRAISKAEKMVIIITHLHADHCGSLPMLISYSFNRLSMRPLLIYPGSTISEFLTLTGIRPEEYELKPGIPSPAAVMVEPILVDHTPLMDCYGYIIGDAKTSIYFSGDAASVPDKILKKFNSREIDLIYQDTTEVHGNNPFHGTLEKLNTLFSRNQRERVVCMHYDTDFREKIRIEGYRTIENTW